jgi:L-asparaginase
MQSHPVRTVVVLGTGGTIAGAASSADDDRAYRSASIGVDALVATAHRDATVAVESEQVAQIDSKDMDFAVWRRLVARLVAQLARPEVAGVVVTHGTDTLEETAYFLSRIARPAKPVVLTAAMRPATSRRADGPRNLADAIEVAVQWPEPEVLVVLAGTVHGARAVRKAHPTRLDAFTSGGPGPLGRIDGGRLERLRPSRDGAGALDPAALPDDPSDWPWVEIVASDAGADGRAVAALRAAGVDGLVAAATGNGTLHRALEAALEAAAAGGVAVLRSSRCLDGTIDDAVPRPLPHAGDLTPVKARVELILRLLEARPR